MAGEPNATKAREIARSAFRAIVRNALMADVSMQDVRHLFVDAAAEALDAVTRERAHAREALADGA